MSFRIRAITLDLDDTLWPFAPIGARVEQVMHAWLADHCPRTAEQFPLAEMRRLREAINAEHPHLAHDFSRLRKLTLARAMELAGDDLVHVDDNGMREIVQRADKKALTIALKGASEEIRARFFDNMSKRAAEMLREEMEVLGAVRLRDVEKAQQDVVAIARKLEEEGVISTGAAAGEAYVV